MSYILSIFELGWNRFQISHIVACVLVGSFIVGVFVGNDGILGGISG